MPDRRDWATLGVVVAAVLLPPVAIVLFAAPQGPDSTAPPRSPWEVDSARVGVENRLRKRFGIRPLDAGWHLRNEYVGEGGTLGCVYEKAGPCGTEVKQVERDPANGEPLSDTDVYPSGRLYADHDDGDADGHPNVDEEITSQFFFRTGRLGQRLDGDEYCGVIYVGDDAGLRERSDPPGRISPEELDRLVADMRRIAGKSAAAPSGTRGK